MESKRYPGGTSVQRARSGCPEIFVGKINAKNDYNFSSHRPLYPTVIHQKTGHKLLLSSCLAASCQVFPLSFNCAVRWTNRSETIRVWVIVHHKRLSWIKEETHRVEGFSPGRWSSREVRLNGECCPSRRIYIGLIAVTIGIAWVTCLCIKF